MQHLTFALLACVLGWQAQTLPKDAHGRIIPWWKRWNSLSAQEKIYYGHDLKGNKLLDHRVYHKALAEYNEMIRLSPDFPDGYTCRAGLYYRLRPFDRSLADWNKVISLERRPGGQANALYNRSLCYAMKNDWDHCIADISRSLELGDIHPLSYLMRGKAF